MNVSPNRLFEKIGILTIENDLLREEVERLRALETAMEDMASKPEPVEDPEDEEYN